MLNNLAPKPKTRVFADDTFSQSLTVSYNKYKYLHFQSNSFLFWFIHVKMFSDVVNEMQDTDITIQELRPLMFEPAY